MSHNSKEHEEQKGFVLWFRHNFPKVLIFAIPNGGKRSIKTAVALRDEGVTAGIPDMYVPEWNLWLEMKRGAGGRISGSQEATIDYLCRQCNAVVIIGYGARDMSIKVLDYLKNKDKRIKNGYVIK